MLNVSFLILKYPRKHVKLTSNHDSDQWAPQCDSYQSYSTIKETQTTEAMKQPNSIQFH